jgi:uncharacterized protein YraI
MFIVGVLLLSLSFTQAVYAGACQIPEFTVSGLHVHWRVECPGGSIGGVRVYLDNDNNVVMEETTGTKDFDVDARRVSNGHHNMVAQVHSPSESWSNATTATVGFDWSGNSPTPIPVPTNPPDPGNSSENAQSGNTGSTNPGQNTSPVPQGSRGLDIHSYCFAQGRQEINTGGADRWYCRGNDGIFPINMADVCQWEYQGGFPYVGVTNVGNASSISCNSQPAFVDPNYHGTQPWAETSNPITVLPVTGGGGTSETDTQTASASCPAPMSPQLVPGQAGHSTNEGQNLRIRASYGTQAQKIDTLPNGAYFKVLEGPECAYGMNWFKIAYEGINGWIAEGNKGTYYVVPVVESGNVPPKEYKAIKTIVEPRDFAILVRTDFSRPFPTDFKFLGKEYAVSFHLACAVFSIPQNELLGLKRRETSYYASDGSKIPAGPHIEGDALRKSYGLIPAEGQYLFMDCIQTRTFGEEILKRSLTSLAQGIGLMAAEYQRMNNADSWVTELIYQP